MSRRLVQLQTLRTTSWSLRNSPSIDPSDLHDSTHGTDDIAHKEGNNVETKGASNELAFLGTGHELGVRWKDESEEDVEKREQQNK